jgi:hypothetical protein
MTTVDGRIDDFVANDDLEIERTISSIPDGITIDTAWFMVKRKFTDSDDAALISKTISPSNTADVGWIEDIGTDGEGLIRFYLTQAETALLTPFSEYQYSIKLLLNNDKVNTPERGVMIAEPAVKRGNT